MKRHPIFALAAAVAVVVGGLRTASAELIYGLTTQNSIAVFDSSDPTNLLDGGAVGMLQPNTILQAIDYRPATQQIYLLDDDENVYTFNPFTFDASLVGNFSPPRLPGVSYGFDFNPSFSGGEFARIITDTNDNRVVSGNTGQYLLPVEKTDVFYDAGDVNAGEDPNVVAIAYTNSVAGAQSTQQYGIDSSLGVLVTVANNAGTLETRGALGSGPYTGDLGLDISGTTGVAYAAVQPIGSAVSYLTTVNLTTGLADPLTPGNIIGAGDVLRSLTVVPIGITPLVPEPATIGLLGIAAVGLIRRRRA